MKRTVVSVKVIWWNQMLPTSFGLYCHACRRKLGIFSQHESAMAWAQAHASGSKHIREG